MPSGAAAVTPGRAAQSCHWSSATAEFANDTDSPPGGAAKAIRSAGRPVRAEVFSLARPAVSPDSSPTSRVISTTTVPISANRPLAKRRSLHATNMAPSLVGATGRGIALRCVSVSTF
ncbi:UNVERIFIED_CONTAM: hypothetical protein RKD43_005784 [Streptomyces graminofaciens]